MGSSGSTVFTRARHWSLSDNHMNEIHNLQTYFVRSILILSFNLRLGLPSGLLPLGLQVKFFIHLSLSHMLHNPHSHPPLCDHPNNI